MELGDYEAPNEFEFDLSDVDVAAFESVATEDTTGNNTNTNTNTNTDNNTTTTTNNNSSNNISTQEQQLPSQQQQQQPQQQSPQPIKTLPQSSPTPQPPKQQQLQHVTQQIASATGTTAGKILLVPINSKTGAPGFKHLFQLPTAPITLTTSNNQRPMIQLTPLSTSSLNTGKNSYSFPITASNQLLPSSSQGPKQQQLFLTTNNSSPMKNQQPSMNSILNKFQNNSQNVQYIQAEFPPQFPWTKKKTEDANEVPKRKPCNCTKSQCLKLYCDCFANGEFCSGCNCTNCFNSLSKEKERQKAISQCLERNPEAFRPKIGKAVKLSVGEPAPDAIERRHTKGCNCKRSGCLKNYCECYEAKILCSNLCKCCGCKNYEESFERKSLMQLANSASENARGILKNLLPTNNNSSTGKDFTKSFITDKVIHASLMCLLQSAQQAEKDGALANNIPNLIQVEMGKCLRMIVDSATESSSPKKR